METYIFMQDVKVRCWRTHKFKIEAENLEEAKKKAMEFLNKSVWGYEGYIHMIHDNYIQDAEFILPSEQDGHETIALYDFDAHYPFADNSDDNYRVKDSQLYKLWHVADIAKRELKNYHIECEFVTMNAYVYDAFHKDGKLNVWKSIGVPLMYVFDESWDSLVKNDKFREHMAMWMIDNHKKSPENDKLVLDWMDGGLTKMWASDERTKEDEVPFSLEDLVRATVGIFSTKHEYKAPELLGYQIAGENGELPDGYLPSYVFKDFEDARAAFRKMKKDEPHKTDMAIYPVFEDEIENPCYIKL